MRLTARERRGPASPLGDGRSLGRALLLLAALAAGIRPAWPVDAALVEQKLRLLEGYFASATARRILEGGNADAAAGLSRARGQVVDARDALAAGDAEHASVLADDAMRAFSAASRMSAQSRGPSARARARYEELRQAIAAFRTSLEGMRETAGSVPVVDLAALDLETGRAAALARDGYFERANAVLAEVYQSTTQAIATARGSETVTYRLEFETPADELAYERERFRGNELLLGMLLDGGASDSAKLLAEGYAKQARARRDAAQAIADGGDVPAAIAAMEDASEMLARALGTLGLPMAR